MNAIYYHAGLDIRVNFNGDRFAILGDEELVSDDTLSRLYNGEVFGGWERV